MDKPKVIVICGPTASGKTSLSIALAKQINGEIISADSMQIYEEMNIGSAKPTREEMQNISHHLIDFVPVDRRYSVAQYQKDALEVIKKVLKKGKVPIVVGGTGLYIDSLIYGIEYQEMETNLAYRQKLEKEVEQKGLSYFYEKAKKIDPVATEKISQADRKRILRIIEIYETTGKTKTQQEKESRKNGVPYDYRVFALTMDREILYERINKRVDLMIEQGLVQEVTSLTKKYHYYPTAMQALGYKEIVEYLENKVTLPEAIDKIKLETRRYAKRQLTWFRKNKQTIWMNALAPKESNIQKVLEELD